MIAVVFRHETRVFRFEVAGRGDDDSLFGVRRAEVDTTVTDPEFIGPRGGCQIEVPGENLLGDSIAALMGWARSATWGELRFAIPFLLHRRVRRDQRTSGDRGIVAEVTVGSSASIGR